MGESPTLSQELDAHFFPPFALAFFAPPFFLVFFGFPGFKNAAAAAWHSGNKS